MSRPLYLLAMPTLYAMSGLSFSGKTVLAAEISAATGAAIVSYDDLYGTVERDPALTGIEEWRLIVSLVHAEARRHLQDGDSVIVDNLNEDMIDRDQLRAIAAECGAETIIVHVEAPLELIRERRRRNDLSRERGTTSDEQFEFVRSKFEPPGPPERVIRYQAGEDLGRWLVALQEA